LNRSSGLFCVTNETGKELLEWVVLCGLHGVQLGVRQSVASFCWATSFFWAILIFFVLQAKVVLLRKQSSGKHRSSEQNRSSSKTVLMIGWPPNICQIFFEKNIKRIADWMSVYIYVRYNAR
jgi:hypothetical protein